MLNTMPSQNSSLLIKNTAILSLRMLVTIVLSFYTSRLILQALGVEDFGVYNVVCGVSSLITVISNSLTEGVNRFVTVEVSRRDESRINKVFALSNSALLIVSILFLLLSETLGLYLFYRLHIPEASLPAAFWVYQFSVLGMIVSFNGIPYVALITAYEKFGFYGMMSVAESVLRLVVTALLFLLPNEKRMIAYGVGLLFVLLIDRVVYVFYVYRLAPFIRYRFSTERSELSILGRFTGYKLLWEFACACGTQGVNIVLNLFFGPLLNAARGIAYQVQNLVYRLLLNFQTPLRPQILKSYSEGDSVYCQRLVSLGTKVSFFVMALMIIPVAIESRQLLTWWLGEYPAYTEVIVSLLCIECLLSASFLPLDFALDAQGEIRKYKIVQSLVYFSILPLTYICFLCGADYYTPFCIANAAQLIILAIRVTMICPKVRIGRTQMMAIALRLLVSFVSCLGLGFCLAQFISQPVLSFVTVCIFSTLYITAALYFYCLNAEEKGILHRQIQKGMQRFTHHA